MKIKNILHFSGNMSVLKFILCVLSLVCILPSPSAEAAEHCSDRFYIDETLPNGARWDMCWEHRQREGITFHHIYYTPKKGQRRMVLNHAAVAQIHVPYDDNGVRFHDISDYGIGLSNIQNFSEPGEDDSILYTLLGIDNHKPSMLELNKDDCPNGTLLAFSEVNVLCQQIENREFAYKTSSHSSSADSLNLFSVSEVGAYFYIPTWRFKDDGTIEPWMGATGALQRFGNDENHGWKLGDERVGLAHLHNFFWKLDFDLDETSQNDVVEEINFPLVNGKRQRTTSRFDVESARKVNPNTMRRWRIRDKNATNSNKHAISYDVALNETGHQDIGPASEPFTHNDFYVTKQKDEERFASHNPKGGKNLAEFTNNESIVNQDIVIWAGVTFYHMPRSEDAPHMDAHWSHMQLIPRDWHASNPLGKTEIFNTPPSISSLKNQTSKVTNTVNLVILATDVEDDTLTYSATGLPAGLSINKKTGIISGTVSRIGENTVLVTVNDTKESSSVEFNWDVIHINKPPQLAIIDDQFGFVGDIIKWTVLANDEDGDNLSYSAAGLPDGLIINSVTGVISGSLDVVGNFPVDITVSDPASNNSKRFNLSVSRKNIPPIASSQHVSVGSSASIMVTLSASDVDNDTLTYKVVTRPSHGTLKGTPPSLTYTANKNYTGKDSFEFKVNDGIDDSSIVTVSLVVLAKDDKSGESSGTNSTDTILMSATDGESGESIKTNSPDKTGMPAETIKSSATVGSDEPIIDEPIIIVEQNNIDQSENAPEVNGNIVKPPPTSSAGGGSLPAGWLIFLGFICLLRCRFILKYDVVTRR